MPQTPPSDESNLRIFVGNKYDYFQRKWALSEQTGSKQSWNWAAFLGSYAWMAYRKMYLQSGILVGVLILETIVEVLLGPRSGVSSLITFFNIGLFVGVGFRGNHWYKRHVEKRIQDILSQCSAERAEAELARAGGTSMAAAVAITVTLLGGWAAIAALIS
ncbi:MAG: DUF2628 domain-containing protein [Rhodocyclales bacterium]|nr:DUF2628 domain-containing protein [Rhodocyclales bacterium]